MKSVFSQKYNQLICHFLSKYFTLYPLKTLARRSWLTSTTSPPPPHQPVAGEPVVSSRARFHRRRHTAEPGRHGVPLVEPHAAPEGVAAGGTLGALLGRHLQELAGLAREGLRRSDGGRKQSGNQALSFFTLRHKLEGKASSRRATGRASHSCTLVENSPQPGGNLILTSCFTLRPSPRSHSPPAEPSSLAHLPDSALPHTRRSQMLLQASQEHRLRCKKK